MHVVPLCYTLTAQDAARCCQYFACLHPVRSGLLGCCSRWCFSDIQMHHIYADSTTLHQGGNLSVFSSPLLQAIFPQGGLPQSQGVASSLLSPDVSGRRRSHTKDGEDDPSEKRQKFLERNRYGYINNHMSMHQCLSLSTLRCKSVCVASSALACNAELLQQGAGRRRSSG